MTSQETQCPMKIKVNQYGFRDCSRREDAQYTLKRKQIEDVCEKTKNEIKTEVFQVCRHCFDRVQKKLRKQQVTDKQETIRSNPIKPEAIEGKNPVVYSDNINSQQIGHKLTEDSRQMELDIKVKIDQIQQLFPNPVNEMNEELLKENYVNNLPDLAKFCGNMNIVEKKFKSYLTDGNYRLLCSRVLFNFDQYSLTTKYYVMYCDIENREHDIAHHYYDKKGIFKGFRDKIEKIKEQYPEIYGYSKSVGRYPWINVKIQNNNNVRVIENKFYEDIIRGYVRIIVHDSDHTMINSIVSRDFNQYSTEVCGTIGAILSNHGLYVVICAHCVLRFDENEFKSLYQAFMTKNFKDTATIDVGECQFDINLNDNNNCKVFDPLPRVLVLRCCPDRTWLF
jgi:hypothetical protein